MSELTRRYVVMTMATEAPFDPLDPEGVFVLKPWKDPAAVRALATYRDNCYPELARDLDVWIRAIEAGPPIRGGIGRMNEAHVKPDVTPSDVTTRPVRPRSRSMVRESTRRPPKARARSRAGKRKKRSP